MRIGVLALQGAFAEHERALAGLGASCVEVRQPRDLSDDLDGLVIPGGESTVMAKLLHDRALAEPLGRAIADGLPVFGTCAGMIMLAREVEGRGAGCLPVLDVVVRRNAFGRQLGSFRTEGAFGRIGIVPMTFIRAPFVVAAGSDVQVLATVQRDAVTAPFDVGTPVDAACRNAGAAAACWGDGAVSEGPGADVQADGETRIVAVRQGSVLATAFHPELTGDARVHEYFVREICTAR